MKRFLLILLLIQGITIFASTKNLLKEATTLYNTGKFTESAEKFEKVLENIKNPDIYYNLGNAYYKSGKLGLAILNYKRSLKMRWDEDCQKNLTLALSQTKDNISENINIFENWILKQNSDNWFKAFLIILSIFSLLISRMIWRRRFRIITISSFLFLLIMTGSIFGLSVSMHSRQEGVVISSETGVQSAPIAGETVSFKLHEGAIVEIVKEQGRWLRIMLPNGLSGWILKKDIGLI